MNDDVRRICNYRTKAAVRSKVASPPPSKASPATTCAHKENAPKKSPLCVLFLRQAAAAALVVEILLIQNQERAASSELAWLAPAHGHCANVVRVAGDGARNDPFGKSAENDAGGAPPQPQSLAAEKTAPSSILIASH